MEVTSSWRRVRVERGIYLLPNGKYYVSARRAGKLWSRTAGRDLALARSARDALVTSIEAGLEPGSPRLRFGTKIDAIRPASSGADQQVQPEILLESYG